MKTISSGWTRDKRLVENTTGWVQKEDAIGVYWEQTAEVAQEIRRKLEESELKELLTLNKN